MREGRSKKDNMKHTQKYYKLLILLWAFIVVIAGAMLIVRVIKEVQEVANQTERCINFEER